MADMKVRVRAHSENATKTVVKARNFQLIIDEPTEMGGTNEGATPVEYVLGAFSGCLNVMAHLIAKEMDITLRGIKIDISGTLNPARLYGQSYDERAGFKEISVVLKPDTDAASAPSHTSDAAAPGSVSATPHSPARADTPPSMVTTGAAVSTTVTVRVSLSALPALSVKV